MKYLYETHLHTVEASKCASSGGADYIAPYIDKGYSGIIVTDHFYHGNSCLPHRLPWKEWVHLFCLGYERAWEEGQRRGLDVFFGWEETFREGDDYLVYGLDKNWLLEHPEVRTWSRGEQYRVVKEAGGCVVQAHPFRQRDYITSIVLSTGCVDGVEVANCGNEQPFDSLAFRYAKRTGKPMTAGSDIHTVNSVYYDNIFGVYLNKKLQSIMDYADIVCRNEIAGIKADQYRYESNHYDVWLPVDIRDENDKSMGKHWKDFI